MKTKDPFFQSSLQMGIWILLVLIASISLVGIFYNPYHVFNFVSMVALARVTRKDW